MTATDGTPYASFAYTAQTFDGQPVSGTVDAPDIEEASRRLATMRLRIIRLDPAQRPVRTKPLGGEDFAAFNQQLAHLSATGLPIEQGLRLIAEDLHHGGLAQSVREISTELDRGVPLGEAFKRHEKNFPPLYGTLVEAGVRSGSLPGVLLNLGRHLELVVRLRAAIWRAAAYPLTVLAGLAIVLVFLGYVVLPQFREIFRDFGTELPVITQILLSLARLTPAATVVVVVIFIVLPLLRLILRSMLWDRAAADLVLPLPMIGPLLRRNLIARWCDALKLAVQAGMDLPAAVQLAGDVIGSPRLRRDEYRIIAVLQAGKPIDQQMPRMSIVPLPVLAVLQFATDRNDLPTSLGTLAAMYEQQAEMRLSTIQSVLTPVLILSVATLIGFTILGLFAPMISLIQSVSG